MTVLATDGITTLAVLGFFLPAVALVGAFAVVVVRDRRRDRDLPPDQAKD